MSTNKQIPKKKTVDITQTKPILHLGTSSERLKTSQDLRSVSKGSIKKRPTHSKTFYSKNYNSETVVKKPVSKPITKQLKHRRVDSGGKTATEKVLEHISKRKRTSSEKESRNHTPEKESILMVGSAKGKQKVFYNNFSSHFNFTT